MGGRLILVGCVAKKRLEPVEGYPKPTMPAKDLYCSPLFEKRRAWAELSVREGRAQAWAILSALFKTVHPDQPLPGYDVTMSYWRKDERAIWVHQTINGIKALLCRDAAYGSTWPDRLAPLAARCERREHRYGGGGYVRCSGCLEGVTIEIHAGLDYTEELDVLLERHGATVELPMKGLGIGDQLGWYKRRLSPQMRLEEKR